MCSGDSRCKDMRYIWAFSSLTGRKGGEGRHHGPGGRRGHRVGHGRVGPGGDGEAPSDPRGAAGRRRLHRLALRRLRALLQLIVGLLAAARVARRHVVDFWWQPKEKGRQRMCFIDT